MKKKESGIGLIDFILVILIIIAVAAILYLSLNGYVTTDTQKVAGENTINYSNTVKKTKKQIENTEFNVNELPNINYNNTYSATYGKFFYDQLDDNEKQMYSNIENNINSLKNGYRTFDILETKQNVQNSFQTAWDALCLDKPELFYIKTSNVVLLTQTTTTLFGGTTYKYSLTPTEGGSYFVDSWKSEEEVDAAIKKIKNETDVILNNAKLQSNRYNTIKYVHDRIIDMCEYDQNRGINDSNIYGVFVDHTAVCEGYAEAFKYMMDKLQIPCVVVYGNGVNSSGNSEFHAWNEVMLDNNKWYAVDCTWDDPIMIGGGEASEELKHKNFLKGSNTFFETHQNEADVSGTGQQFKYPKLSETDYNS